MAIEQEVNEVEQELRAEVAKLRAEALAVATSAVPTKAKVIIGVLLVAVVLGIAGFINTYHIQRAQVVATETFASTAKLATQLSTNEINAKGLQQFYDSVMTGKVTPVAEYYVQSPTVQSAATKVSAQINKKDATLPAAALETTDRTVVVPNTVQQKVDVYKVNLYKNWEIGIGAGVHNGDSYLAVGMQRNYSRDHAIEAEVHVRPTGVITGGEVKYKVMTDKLFGVF